MAGNAAVDAGAQAVGLQQPSIPTPSRRRIFFSFSFLQQPSIPAVTATDGVQGSSVTVENTNPN
ncbi:hypothetical protein ABBQ38_011518 [Trebouxia sp. C0009 RCD-2024]